MRSIHIFSTSRSDFASVIPIISHSTFNPSDNISLYLFSDVTSQQLPQQLNQKITINRIDISIAVDKADVASVIASIHNTLLEISRNDPMAAVFIIGDRWEILTIAQMAILYGLVVIHHSGGDITNGAIDNKIRDSVSSLADYHLVSHSLHAARLIRMGESEAHIFVVGEPALNNLKYRLQSADEAMNESIFIPQQKFILACFHASTVDIPISEQIEFIQRVLALCHEHVVITYPNMDPGGLRIHECIQSLSTKSPERITYLENLGSCYYNYLSRCYFVLGNSSSGIFEACMAKKITINIGNRQAGRLRSASVLDVQYNIDKFFKLYEQIPRLYETLDTAAFDSPYFDNRCLEKISAYLTRICSNPDQPVKLKSFR